MKVVVTGGSGGIGHLVCLDLAQHGHEVVNATRSAPRQPQPGVRFVQVDTSEMGALISEILATESQIGPASEVPSKAAAESRTPVQPMIRSMRSE